MSISEAVSAIVTFVGAVLLILGGVVVIGAVVLFFARLAEDGPQDLKKAGRAVDRAATPDRIFWAAMAVVLWAVGMIAYSALQHNGLI